MIVNYRSADHVVACAQSLLADGVSDIVVVDNASGDGSEAGLARAGVPVRWIGLDHNCGYGAAANRGVRMTTGSVVLVCNPDLVVAPGTARALAGALAADPALGAVGPRIDRPDGSRYPSARAFPSIVDSAGHGFLGLVTTSNPFSQRYLRAAEEAPGPVDWVSGACLAVRRQAFDLVGGFDEAFFMFMEDVDLCWRLGRAGWGIRYEPAARVTHEEGVSRQSAPYRMILAHHRSLFRYGLRTTSGRQRLWLPLVALGLVIRAALLCLRRFVHGPAWESGGSVV